MKRKLLSISIVVAILICSFSVQAFADDGLQDAKNKDEVGLRYTYITTVHTTLSIGSNGRAVTGSAIFASSNVDKVVMSSYLQRYDSGWKTVKQWSKTTYSNTGTMENVWYVTVGSYRVLTYFYAYDGSNVESTSLIAYDSY